MRAFLIGTDKAENHGPIDTALRQSGHELINAVCSLAGLPGKLADMQPRPDVVLVRADVVRRENDTEQLAVLAEWPVIVLLPRGRFSRRAALEALSFVRGVIDIPPFDFSRLMELCASPTRPTVVTSNPPAASVHSATQLTGITSVEAEPISGALRRQVRLGFYGARGGVGVSTTALKVAQLIATRAQRTALFDATGRGDLHLLLNVEPQPLVVIDSLSVFLGAPTEGLVRGFDAVIIDSGRRPGAFNARWIEITRPPGEQAIARWVVGEESASYRSFNVGPLVSIEVTD